MLACVISSAVGELIFRGGLYDHLMRWNGINLRGLHSDESIPVENIRALKAMDVMHKKVKTFSGSTLVKDVLPAFSSSAQKGFAVVEKGILVGIVTQTDLTRISEVALLEKMTVSEIMTPHPVAVHSHDSLEDILFLFSYYKFTWLPVTYHDKLEGIIFQSDVLKAVFAEADKMAEKVAEQPNEEQLSTDTSNAAKN
jgi:CIC family chloride channel protein